MPTLTQPLVTVICVCYNQAPWVRRALQSVTEQTYANIELIIADDASTDHSRDQIRTFLHHHGQVPFIAPRRNMGHCAIFNQALQQANGHYIIDLAADDYLDPDRVEAQVAALQAAGPACAFCYTDAWLIDAGGHIIGSHYRGANPPTHMPQGNIYKRLFMGAFICPPTVMFNANIMHQLGGYDAQLSYEDFDYYMRACRQHTVCYLPQRLTYRRLHKQSARWGFYQLGKNPHLTSTLVICQKALTQNQTPAENQALYGFAAYHMRQAWLHHCFGLAGRYAALLKQIAPLRLMDKLIVALARFWVPAYWFYAPYRWAIQWLQRLR